MLYIGQKRNIQQKKGIKKDESAHAPSDYHSSKMHVTIMTLATPGPQQPLVASQYSFIFITKQVL